jgi:TIR domain
LNRQSIFISHATPEDNGFIRWLGARLELAGFSVWHDLGRLKGGDYFWDKIEKAIREESFKFLAVVSKASVNKPGVKDEWALAQTIEKSLPGFVIPVRLDDYNFSQLPIGIHRKNVVDFASGWHKGLAQLIDTLVDANAPKIFEPDPLSARHWLAEMKEGAILRTNAKESLDSTWLSVMELPPALETARILGNARLIKLTDENRRTPWFEHEDQIVGFTKGTDLVSLMSKSVMLKAAGGIATDSFISSGGSLGAKTVTHQEARKRVANLVRQAWELAMEAKGFGIYEQSGGRKVFYVTPELTGGRGEKVSFIDVDGRKRRKGLNGRSEKRKSNWSYAVGIVPAFDDPWRIELRSTIVFTGEDGKPMDSVARAHRLRMSFCRSWWNDRWRGFLRAFLALVAEGQQDIRLPVGSDRFVVLSATPIVFSAPAGLSDLAPSIDADPIDEPDDDLGEVDDIDEEVEP